MPGAVFGEKERQERVSEEVEKHEQKKVWRYLLEPWYAVAIGAVAVISLVDKTGAISWSLGHAIQLPYRTVAIQIPT